MYGCHDGSPHPKIHHLPPVAIMVGDPHIYGSPYKVPTRPPTPGVTCLLTSPPFESHFLQGLYILWEVKNRAIIPFMVQARQEHSCGSPVRRYRDFSTMIRSMCRNERKARRAAIGGRKLVSTAVRILIITSLPAHASDGGASDIFHFSSPSPRAGPDFRSWSPAPQPSGRRSFEPWSTLRTSVFYRGGKSPCSRAAWLCIRSLDHGSYGDFTFASTEGV